MRTVLILSVLSLFLSSSKPFDSYDKGGLSFDGQTSLLSRQIIRLQEIDGPMKTNIVWSECGKRVKRDAAEGRAREYSEAIMKSVEDVYVRTGVWIDPRHPAAILYRESSFNECVIGKRETKKLASQLGREPNKSERVRHLRRWNRARAEAKRWCKTRPLKKDCVNSCMGKGKRRLRCRAMCKATEAYSACVRARVEYTHPEYQGIYGWDLGAAQFRWPGWGYSDRQVVVPDGKTVDDLSVESFFDYKVSIQMLVENLARFKVACKDHKHYKTNPRNGRRLKLIPTEEAYLAHHHTGPGAWSEKYWRALSRHLRDMDTVQADPPRLARFSLRKFLPRIFL